MTIRFQIRADYDSLKQFITGVSEEAVWRAALRAGNDSLKRLRTESGRRVRAERKLKARTVRHHLHIFQAHSKGPGGKTAAARWRLGVAGAPIPLYLYGARKTKRGVSVNVSGKRKIVGGAFIATMKSGHTGVFKRQGKKRLPIEELFSSRVSDVFQNTGFIPRVHEFFQERFTNEWHRLVPVEIEKAKRRARSKARRR